MKEGARTVLDHSCLIFINNMGSGSKHESTRVPLLTLCGLGGHLETGRVLEYGDRPDNERKLCSFYLSLMNRMDFESSEFGDSQQHLAGL
jgi:hypothetical protein